MRYYGVVLAVVAALSVSACSTLGMQNSAFGDSKAGLDTVPNIEFYSSDQALTEGMNQFEAQNYGKSATLFKRAVEVNPVDAQAWLGLAASYDRLRRFDLADRAYAKLHGLIGGTVEYYNNVGYSYLLRGDLKRARAAFLKAYDLDPKNEVVANNLELLGSSLRYAER